MTAKRRTVRTTASFFEDLDGQLASDGAIELVELDIDTSKDWD